MWIYIAIGTISGVPNVSSVTSQVRVCVHIHVCILFGSPFVRAVFDASMSIDRTGAVRCNTDTKRTYIVYVLCFPRLYLVFVISLRIHEDHTP